MSRTRWLPLSGIAFVVVALVAIVGLGGNTPDPDASADKVASFYDAHNGRQSAAAFLLAVAVAFLAIFGTQLAARFSPNAWTRLLTVGTAAASAVLLLTALIHFALADAADKGVAGDAIRALNIVDSDGWLAWNAGLGVMMLGAGGAILASVRVLPRLLGWAAAVFGVALFIPFADFIALLLTLIWMLVTSFILWRRHAGQAIPQPA
jgi:hypothetical protein